LPGVSRTIFHRMLVFAWVTNRSEWWQRRDLIRGRPKTKQDQRAWQPMRFHADLHVHSKYSRATSRDLDLEHLAALACRKGIRVVGTGDFTHPAWRAELKQKLVPAEAGLVRLRDDSQQA